MRYVNTTTSPKYNSVANKLMNPGAKSSEITELCDTINKLAKCGSSFVIELSKADWKALDLLSSKLKVDKERLKKAIKQGKTDPLSSKQVYEETEAYYIAKSKAVSKEIKEHREKEARINAESNFILPDGRPVGKDEAELVSGMRVKEGTKIDPHYVERPMSPLDILSHNAKVSTERAQYKPLSGKEAVAARVGSPGMPNLPGIEKHMETLAKEKAMADAMKAGIMPVSTADMLASGEKNNYGRK